MDEYAITLKGPARSHPGFGIPKAVFLNTMSSDPECITPAVIDLWFHNHFQQHMELYKLMALFMNAHLQKAGNESYAVCSSWRNTTMGLPSRKSLTKMDCTRLFKYLEAVNVTRHTVLSGRKGLPAIVYAIKKIALGIHMAATEKLNIIIRYADIKICVVWLGI